MVEQKDYRGISKNFSYNGFKFLEQQGDNLIFTRYDKTTGKTHAMKCTIDDMSTGYFYKLADAGLSRV